MWKFPLLLLLLPICLAQFGFFQGNPFHPFQQQQQQPPPSGQGQGRGHKGWDEMDNVHCKAGYVCPSSLTCVSTPANCPCPYPEDIKCVIPDHRPRDEGEGPPFVCVRGPCDEVFKFSGKI
ncbi:hypothetical protein TREMEDRAFT_70561 [Tremella mesenterica DSM 1558]|uniref:uncharacterized protein n=1 Tax=Tremella mesenterica (strain ATCC 24925 / CBS 8224 / DSM 1558 / NBRC 9311 / NRRL Y-6157 / RJB 2259-6 / UBC 559-6) TaxID=578456 RepID=UPI00032C7CC7|nr:uncharacterized protein TREMEDRAFT_70561 [Tremella mesenterica DSM 1558]EIW65487.1 hypothetical protein TREMEDRAFT_70561 [Tremella mesenterica DSM 1558]